MTIFDRHLKTAFLDALDELPAMRSQNGMTAKNILISLNESSKETYKSLKHILFRINLERTMDLYCDQKPLSSSNLGYIFRRFHNCSFNGKKLIGERNSHTGTMMWKIQDSESSNHDTVQQAS